MRNLYPIRALLSAFLLFALAVSMAGCTSGVTDLMAGITPGVGPAAEGVPSQDPAFTDFAVRLLQQTDGRQEKGETPNTLLSPLSVVLALALTANGAEGETLRQMESLLGMPFENLNAYLHAYLQALSSEKKTRLLPANSVWFTNDDRLTVSRDFLQRNVDFYGADIYKAPFDKATCREINRWVMEKTEGMIPEILDAIPPDAVFYLVNALTFDGEWEESYMENAVREGVFRTEDGNRRSVEFLHSTEHAYLENESFTGFLKYYKGKKYAFAALLPREGTELSDCIAALDGEGLRTMLASAKELEVDAAIPKFKVEYNAELREALSRMGMPRAFSADAEFGGIGKSANGNIWISRILHKTFLAVDERGTRAGAASVVEMETGGMPEMPPKTVHLNRPFVYFLLDCENNIPIFIGAMRDLGK